MDKVITVQEFSDDTVHPDYKQPLKTIEEACESIGWKFEDEPSCCGEKVQLYSMLGSAYHAQCKTCGRFVVDVAGPRFSGNSVSFLDTDKVDIGEDGRTWISGRMAPDIP